MVNHNYKTATSRGGSQGSIDKRQVLEGVQIRRPMKKDIIPLVALENVCFTDYYRAHRFAKSNFQSYLRQNRTIFFVAIKEPSLIGYVAGHIRSVKSQIESHLDSIAVLPESRNQGIGNQLLQHFIAESKRRSCQCIILEVANANKNGIHFFTRRGFQITYLLPSFYGKRVDGLLMKLEI